MSRIPGMVTAALLIALGGCSAAPQTAVGSTAPPYSASTLTGESVSLAALRGEVVLLNIWATWCFPCRREMPSFEALHRDLGPQGLHVIAVSIDRAGAAGEIEEFLHEHGITFRVLHDPEQQVARTFSAIGVPETYLIDRNGVLVRHWIGRIDGHSEQIRAPIREALGGPLARGS
jgi:peroxiredoxin